MCLQNVGKKIKAKKDIIVYKTIMNVCKANAHKYNWNKDVIVKNGDYLTSFQYTPVVFNTVMESELQPYYYDANNMCVDIGLHSFKNEVDADLQAQHYKETLVQCIIPKGSTYYEGTFETFSWAHASSFASDQLIYDKIIKDYTK